MFPPEKKLRQQSIAAANLCTTNSDRLFVTDIVRKRRYIVDTGSDLCDFPRNLLPGPRKRTEYILYTANGTTIPTYGWISQSINLGTTPRHHMAVRDIRSPVTDNCSGPAFTL